MHKHKQAHRHKKTIPRKCIDLFSCNSLFLLLFVQLLLLLYNNHRKKHNDDDDDDDGEDDHFDSCSLFHCSIENNSQIKLFTNFKTGLC